MRVNNKNQISTPKKDVNKLYYGDCLDVMRDIPHESVDLIYLDPPFNSNRTYNAIYKDETGRELPDQVEAFCDIWTLDADTEEQIRNFSIKSEDDAIIKMMLDLWGRSLRNKDPKLLAYLYYMAIRLMMMKELLKPTGSLYFHCDTTVSHYVKPFMDVILGHKNFRNELVWLYEGREISKKKYNKKHDIILFYTKSARWTFNWEEVALPLKASSKKALSRFIDEDGMPYVLRYKKGGGFAPKWKEGADDVYRQYVPDKVPPRDWVSIDYARKNERLGYDTQKPLELLENIIKVSSNKGDLVLDPFCGCATTIEAAQNLNRRWIGIDIAIHAIKRVAKVRLRDRCSLIEGEHYIIDGIPRSFEGAKDLWKRDKYQFQRWAIEQVDGFVTKRKTADRGIDGRIFFKGDRGIKSHASMVLEVKGGVNVSISDVRDLRGVMEREDGSIMAGLIVLHELSERKKANFMREMATAGKVSDRGRQYDRMQLLTVRDILEGKLFDTPQVEGKGSKEQGLDLV